jgi:hypothetical protein
MTERLYKEGNYNKICSLLNDPEFNEIIEFHHGGLMERQKDYISFLVSHGKNVHVYAFGRYTGGETFQVYIGLKEEDISSVKDYEITPEFTEFPQNTRDDP